MAKQLILGTDVIQLTESLNVAGDKNIEIKADGKKYYATLWEKGKSVANAISIGLVKIGTNKYGILTSPVRGRQESHEFFPSFTGGTTQERNFCQKEVTICFLALMLVVVVVIEQHLMYQTIKGSL